MKSSVIVDHQVNLYTTTCIVCGVVFAFPDHLEAARRRDGETFYCPSGHGMVFKSEIERLKKEVEIQRLARGTAEKEAAYQKAEREKAEKKLRQMTTRISRGVCPCCKRSFRNLRRHMENKHPDQVPPAAPTGKPGSQRGSRANDA